MSAAITFDNIQNQETVHQRCLLVTGRCENAATNNGHVEVMVNNQKGRARFPEQQWPLCQGHFKALAILEPGENLIRVTSGQDTSDTTVVSYDFKFPRPSVIVC